MKKEQNCYATKCKKAENESIIQKGKKNNIIFTCENDNMIAVKRERLIKYCVPWYLVFSIKQNKNNKVKYMCG